MRTPSVSPTHHVPHVIGNSAHGIWPLTARVVTPTVALIRQLTGPPSTRKAPISRALVSAVGKPTQRRTRNAPTRASMVAPTPILVGIATEVSSAAAWVGSKAVQILTRNDPSQMPGQTRAPPIRMPANASPEGGQSGVA